MRTSYKIFSRLVHQRLVHVVNDQSKDQFGFRLRKSVHEAFIIYETVVTKCLERNVPLWTASLDLRKAFDRIEYETLSMAYVHKV